MSTALIVILIIIFMIVGFILGWVVSALYFKKQMDKNPIINEDQIRELYKRAGKKLSETQVLKIMNSIKGHGKK